MSLQQVFGWQPRVEALELRLSDTKTKLDALQRRREELLLDKELGHQAAAKQLSKIDGEISDCRKKLDDAQQTLDLAIEKAREEERDVETRRRASWVKEVEGVVDTRLQLAKKADKKLAEFLTVLNELNETSNTLKNLGVDREVRRVVQLPALKARLQAAYGVQLLKFFTIHVNPAHRDTQIPLADLEERESHTYIQHVRCGEF